MPVPMQCAPVEHADEMEYDVPVRRARPTNTVVVGRQNSSSGGRERGGASVMIVMRAVGIRGRTEVGADSSRHTSFGTAIGDLAASGARSLSRDARGVLPRVARHSLAARSAAGAAQRARRRRRRRHRDPTPRAQNRCAEASRRVAKTRVPAIQAPRRVPPHQSRPRRANARRGARRAARNYSDALPCSLKAVASTAETVLPMVRVTR